MVEIGGTFPHPPPPPNLYSLLLAPTSSPPPPLPPAFIIPNPENLVTSLDTSTTAPVISLSGLPIQPVALAMPYIDPGISIQVGDSNFILTGFDLQSAAAYGESGMPVGPQYYLVVQGLALNTSQPTPVDSPSLIVFTLHQAAGFGNTVTSVTRKVISSEHPQVPGLALTS